MAAQGLDGDTEGGGGGGKKKKKKKKKGAGGGEKKEDEKVCGHIVYWDCFLFRDVIVSFIVLSSYQSLMMWFSSLFLACQQQHYQL